MKLEKLMVAALLVLGLAACSDDAEVTVDTTPPLETADTAPLVETNEAAPPDETTNAMPPMGAGDTTPPVLGVDFTGEQAEAVALYQENCASCHEGAVKKAPHTQMIGLLTPEAIVKTLTDGLMKAEGASLSPEQKIAVAQLLSGRKLGEPSPYQNPVCSAETSAIDMAQPPHTQNWGLQISNTRLIPTEAAGLTKTSADGLALKWAFAFPGANRARSQPTIAGGSVFVGSHDGQVYALDKETGCIRWTFQASAEVRTGIALDSWSAGDADAAPRAYFGDILGNIYAVNARTGEQVWRLRPEEQPNITITGTPSLFEGRLYVPVSSLEVVPATFPDYECCTFRGSIVAYDAATGNEIWTAYTIEELATPQGQNPIGTTTLGPSGAGIWNSPTIDAKRRQIYVGTSENFSSPATLTSDAIIAFDLKTGARKWAFQATSNDAWNQSCAMPQPINCPKEDGPDFDFGAATMLVSASNGVDYVIGGQKSGVVHALNPDTGAVIWQKRVGRGGTSGGVHFGMAAKGDHLFIPISDLDDGQEYAEAARPGLYALDVKTGEFVWKSPYKEDNCAGRSFCNPGISAAITATPEFVLVGGQDGVLRIHDGDDGAILWRHDTTLEVDTVSGETSAGGSIGGGAGPIMSGDMLFVNSGYGIYGHMPGNLLLAFQTAGE
jgi:polyvinyl alcohol dehydrogenase (cytochrome)